MTKYLPSLLLTLAFGFTNHSAYSQHIKIDKELLSFLASEEKVNVVFSYNNLYLNGDMLTEEAFLDYINTKIIENADREMASQFQADYIAAKEQVWPEMFVNTLNEKVREYDSTPRFVLNDPTTTYTILINTNWMYFGYDIEIIDRPAKVTMDLTFFKNANPDNIITKTEISRAMGTYNKQENDGDIWPRPSLNRMSKAYKRAAYKFAQALKRILD